jgi:long-subunit acyl-CoA synthetase (AMP-forming)
VRLLAATDAGRALLGGLRGGVVGGAPADAALAAALAGTRLRVGYGQTEASPGITLGDPGAWRAGALGRPLGCEVRLDADGVLAFRGPNACLGTWVADGRGAGALTVEPPDRWVRTGDLARAEADGTYTYEGRAADSFKLANGRFVAAAAVEGAVRARWPRLGEVLLSTPDGTALVLAVSPADGGNPGLDPGGLAEVLGPLAGRPLRVVRVEPDAWARTPKGELDRRFPTGRPSA